MRSQLRGSGVACGAAVVVATLLLWGGTASVDAQAPAPYTPARTAAGQPDLNGFWQAINTANWDVEEHAPEVAPHETLVGAYLAKPPGFGVVEGGTIPYNAAGLAQRAKHLENRLKPDPLPPNDAPYDNSDPEAKCFHPGVPRGTYMPLPFQIVQSHNYPKIFIAYTFGGDSTRVINLDKTFKDLLENYAYPGQSIGRWVGNTLEVETRWFNTSVWLDRSGNFYGENAVVTERYTLTSPFHMMYEVTIEDPSVFTRPWKMSMPLYKLVDPSSKLHILEFSCVPLTEEFSYGKFKKGVFKLPDLQ
ncbi:MAG: hypothetical protein HYX77_04525 [Acidobacteria bacterium]|nr:hypothetical protein [Acidobacteriota bacterium]